MNEATNFNELAMNVTAYDLNQQIQKLIQQHVETQKEEYKVDAEYLRSEFPTWWNEETSQFNVPE